MARTISEIYSDYLTEIFIKEKLKQGIIPTSEEIDAHIGALAEETEQFSRPLFKEDVFHVEEREISSKEKMNKTIGTLYSDLSVLYRSLVDQGEQASKIFDSNFSKLKGLERQIQDMSEDVESLLFASQYSDRYEELFYEKFKNASAIDIKNSSTDHDLGRKSITLKPDNIGVLDFEIKSGDLEVSTVNSAGILSSAPVQGMQLLNIFNERNTIWQYQVIASEDLPIVSVDLVVRIPDSSKVINQILIEPADASNRSKMSVEIKVSEDGLNWDSLDGEWRKRLIGDTNFSFKGIKANFIKFRLIKAGLDAAYDGKYTYNFGLKNIKFIGTEYKIEKRLKSGTFYSKPIIPQKSNSINRLGIMSCHTKPEGTGIRYSIALLSAAELLEYNQNMLSPDDLNYYEVNIEESKQLVTFDTKSLLESEQSLNNISLDDAIEYEFKASSNCALGLDTSSLLKSETKILRRKGDNSIALIPDKETFIGNDPFGWRAEGEYYCTVARVTAHGGVTIDLGDTTMIIDGSETSGVSYLGEGFHKIRVHKNNWYSIDLSEVTGPEINPDILYPYNHKYLIEGLQEELYARDLDADQGGWTYREAIDPDGLYTKKMDHWAFEMRELESFDFNYSKPLLDTFSYKVDNSGIERIVVHAPNKNDLLLNERFSIITKVQDSDPVKAVIFKASLETENERVTPVVTEYLMRIK